MNLVACSWGRANLGPGDEVVVSRMEHHSVIVPWQMACESAGAFLRVAPITGRGELDLEGLRSVVGDRTRAVCVCHVSNTLGTVNPVREVCEIAREAGAVSVVDGAQAAAHEGVDVSSIGCDFYALSGHKAFGPMGIGALWGRGEVLESMGPWQGGGEMITRVSFDSGIGYAGVPGRFEAGTPNVAGAFGFAAALEFLGDLGGSERWRDYERGLCEMLTDVVEGVGGSRVIGVAGGKAPVVSFVVDGVHPHDLGTYLDTEGVAVRTGHHCTQPLMEWFGVPATTRASLAFYNTESEIEAFGGALGRAVEFFR